MKALLRSLVVAALGTTVAAEPATLDDAKPDEAVRRTRPLNALMIGLGGIFAIALLSDQFDGWLRKPARAEAAAPPAAVANGPTRPSAQRLCFGGPGGELLDFATTGADCH